jgi:hypothetical protein
MPFAINVITGTSYGFLFFWFFAVEACFTVFNIFKLHENCIQNTYLRLILGNLAYILTLFIWINQWATMTSWMPFAIHK